MHIKHTPFLKNPSRRSSTCLFATLLGALALSACSTGGDSATKTVDSVVYEVGDQGPAGGTIFYAAPTPFPCGSNLDSMCTYLEVSPEQGGDNGEWCSVSDKVLDASGTAIGTGMKNTSTADKVCSSGAVQWAADYEHGGKTDWFLPSIDELHELYKAESVVGPFIPDLYWSSSERGSGDAVCLYFYDGSQSACGKMSYYQVRPVRAL